MAHQATKQIRHTKAPIAKKVKMGGRVVISSALVKPAASNFVPKIHVKRGDMVMLVSGSKKAGQGKTGKVLQVFPKTHQVIVEGINMVTRATKPRTAMGKSGLVKKEAPIAASRVMLFSPQSKKPVRAEFRAKEGID